MRSFWQAKMKDSRSSIVERYGIPYGGGLFILYLLMSTTGFMNFIIFLLFVVWICMTIRIKGNSLFDWQEAYKAIYVLNTPDPRDGFRYGSCCRLDYVLQDVAGERQRAISTLKILSSTMPLARGHLGLCYLFGNGVERDINKGWDLCLSAARDLNYEGIYGIGHCYEHGIAVAKNEVKALAIYQMASKEAKNNRVNMIVKIMGALTALWSMILIVGFGYFFIGWIGG
jgi:hypothetical protein